MMFHFDKQNKIKNIFPLIISIVITQIIQIRPYFFGNFYGDPFDGRLQIVLHEHWFRFFSGFTSLRNTNFFHPYEFGLGLSDPFIIQGSIHSIFRYMNFDMFESWALSNIVMIFIGNLGFALIAHVAFKSNLIKFFFILINGLSYTYIAHIYLHPNITGFALIPYIFFIAINKRFKTQNKVSLIYITLLVLAITSWYGFVLTLLYGITYSLLNFRKFNLSIILRSLKSKVFIFSNIFASPIIVLFLYIHLPVLDEVVRTKDEMLMNSPNINNILNGSQLGGGLFNFIYNLMGFYPNKFFKEYEIGLTASVFLLFLINFIVLISINKKSNLLKMWVANLIILIIFFTFNDFSIFSLIWDSLSIFTSIRIPIRYLVILASMNIFIFLSILDNFYIKEKSRKKLIVVFTFLFILFVDQLRFQTSEFIKKDYNSDKVIEKTLIKNKMCQSFYLDTEGIEWWNDQLEAMIISSSTGIPTVNGYSGGFPVDYPNQDWRSRADLGKVINWLKSNNAVEGTCLLKRNYSILFSQSPIVNIISGFDLTEIKSDNSWNWGVDKSSDLRIYNFQDTKLVKTMQFVLKIPPCVENKSIDIYFDNKFISKINLSQSNKSFLFQNKIEIDPNSEITIEFKTDENYCGVENDLRNLYFNLLNVKFI